ncbi:MAG: beta-1,6-N-acetylglucosaminyltransferase [Pseudomonadota bacterium]
MKIGFVMLTHTALDRATEVAKHWLSGGCPIVIHVDKRTDNKDFRWFKDQFQDSSDVHFIDRLTCDWGRWSIVEATQIACEKMLSLHPDVTHVFLASGSCISLRPISELEAYLESNPRTDFIESVTTDDVDWTVGGLDRERFTLRFPFSWKRQRTLFDAYVNIQRKLGLKRRIPNDVDPHMGSQWWCLTRQTLSAILQSDRREVHDQYFKAVWIPDESYFQSLARLYAIKIESRSLTLSKFDFQGKPHVFYDDHLQLLRRSECFVARKIWPHANRLYSELLAASTATPSAAEPNPLKIDKLFDRATERRTLGRPGLYMVSRFPNHGWENGKTSGPYSVFQGFDSLFDGFEAWLSKRTGNPVHGRLFDPDRVMYADGETHFKGTISNSAGLRDYDPVGFLTNMMWSARSDHICFQLSPGDAQDIVPFLAADRNAQISIVTGAWAIPLFQSNLDFAVVRKHAAALQRAEAAQLEQFRSSLTKARVQMWSLSEFIDEPMQHLQYIIDRLSSGEASRVTEVPRMADLSGFGKFLQNLKNQGMSPANMGAFPVGDATPRDVSASRPYVVK